MLTYIRLVIAIAVGILANTGFVYGQVSPQSKPDLYAQLTEALDALAQRGKVAFVMEDFPLSKYLASSKFQSFVKGNNTSAQSFLVTLSRLAEICDYQVIRRNKTVLLVKKYSDAADLPSVTPEEMIFSLRQIRRFLEPFNPHLRWNATADAHVKAFIDSLTAEQKGKMADRTVGLKYTDLSANQKAFMATYASNFFIQDPCEDLDRVLNVLECLAKPDTKIGIAPQGLISLAEIKQKGEYGWTYILGQKSELAQIQEEAAFGETGAEQNTILSAVTAVNQVLTSAGTQKIQVEEPLQKKPAIIISSSNAPSSELITAIAELYGLRIVKKKEGLLLAMPKFSSPTNLANVNRSVRNAFPLSYQRYMHMGEIDPFRLHHLYADYRTSSLPPAEKKIQILQLTQKAAAWQDSHAMPPDRDTIRRYALKHLLTYLERRFQKTKESQIFVHDMDVKEQKALSVVAFAPSRVGLTWLLFQEPPDYVTYLDETILIGGIRKGDKEDLFEMSLCLFYPDGNLVEINGVKHVSVAPTER